MQSPSSDVPQGAAPDLLLAFADRKKKQQERSKEENEATNRDALYGVVSSPPKDSARLTLKLSRVKLPDADQPEEAPPKVHIDSDLKTDAVNSNGNNQLSRTAHDCSHKLGAEEQASCQQVPVRPYTKDLAVAGGAALDDAEIDTLAEMERIERDSASERERWSKEVQDKGTVWLLPSSIHLMPCVGL